MKHALKTGLFLVLLSPLLLFALDREPIDSEDVQKEEEVVEQTEQISFNYIYDQYPKVYLPTSAHTIASVSAYGDIVELEDGSLWSISAYDGRRAMQWPIDEIISITQNTRWFSSCYYRIINRYTGASIETNLSQGPFTGGILTYYVTEFDFSRGIVTLANPTQSTYWEIHPSDLFKFQNWDFTQPIPVLLGDNNEYTGHPDYKWECILINVKQSRKYIRAHQF
jgi:hypothetical protein